ncbi:MAG TPA: FG-GAP repeat protein [Terriglobia bacterium]
MREAGRSSGILMASLVLCVTAFGVSARADGGGKAQPAGNGISSLPLEAQCSISAALGRDLPAYRVHARGVTFQAVNTRQNLAADFTAHGVAVRTGGTKWGMALRGYGYGDDLTAVNDATPQAGANQVKYRRGPLTEWYVNGPLGLEQGFALDARPNRPPGSSTLTPSVERGDRAAVGERVTSGSSAMRMGGVVEPLTIVLALAGDLVPSVDSIGEGLTLAANGHPTLRYTGLEAHDVDGKNLRAWLEVQGDQLLLHADDAGARYPITIDPIVQLAELTASGGQGEDTLGASVAISGNTVVAGAPGVNYGQGAAYVFVKPASGWANMTETAELTASDGATNDAFGAWVAISGNTVVIGAYGAPLGYSQGAAYVFVKPAGGWATMTETAELTASNGKEDDWFGASVSISANTVAIGAPYAANSSYEGAVYVFVKPSAGWMTTASFNAELVPSQGTYFGECGMSAAISENTVVAGAQGATVGSHGYQGAVYVFAKPADGWAGRLSSIATLTASDGAVGDRLGNAVAASGDTVVGGAYQNNTAQGAAYVFVEPATGWASMTQTAKLTASDGAAYDWFGYSVAISGKTLVAGASDADNYQGAAYLYLKPASGWTTTSHFAAKLVASDGAGEDVFGTSVAISGATVAVGSDGWPGGDAQGAAYVFGP